MTKAQLQAALEVAGKRLLGLCNAEGFWEGRLSSSALSTATAVSALALANEPGDAGLIRDGVEWLASSQNADFGWGDTPDSPSNLATTLLVVAALELAEAGDTPKAREAGWPQRLRTAAELARARAASWLAGQGADTPAGRVAAIGRRYGEDRTFAVPILMNCALAGQVPWEEIPGLPFELATLPQALYPLMKLQVVSYALPALIAIGLLLDDRAPARQPLTRAMRRLAAGTAEAKLARLQPESGGFLEATPLTAFVAMSLIARTNARHPVARRALAFLRASARPDGSWPIDSNLSVWVTTGAATALTAAGMAGELEATRAWIRARQYTHAHPYTGAAAGGWGWTHLPGGVPDADDTAGAMVALAGFGERAGLAAGTGWLHGLQNDDGGWPTFCRGWGQLPLDRSSPDITAHALRALHAADPSHADPDTKLAIVRALCYLADAQRMDGAWVPLWFGNQQAPEEANPVLGTARVLRAYADLGIPRTEPARGVDYLVAAQHPDGGWGGAAGVPATVEETALAVAALADWRDLPRAERACHNGAAYLARRIEDGTWTHPSPLGLYFASLWYAEELYPIIWTVEALARVSR